MLMSGGLSFAFFLCEVAAPYYLFVSLAPQDFVLAQHHKAFHFSLADC